MLGVGESNWLCVLTPQPLQHTQYKGTLGERSLVIFTTLKLTLDCICVLSVNLEYLVELLLLRMKAALSFSDKAPSPGLHMPTVNRCSCRGLSWRAVLLCAVRWKPWAALSKVVVFMHQPPGNYLAICGLTGVGDFIQTQQLDLICQPANKNSVGWRKVQVSSLSALLSSNTGTAQLLLRMGLRCQRRTLKVTQCGDH